MNFTRSVHLTALIADSERLAAHLAATKPPAEAVLAAREADLLASLHLDGSTIPHNGGWAAAIRTRGEVDRGLAAADADVWQAELAGLRSAQETAGLGEALRTDPLVALTDLHVTVTEGLVDGARRGAWREKRRTVTDASIGRIIYWPTRPAEIGMAMADVAAWLVGPGTREHGLVRAGWLLFQVLRIQPWDAANGRVARVAARAVLADAGLDPHGVAPIDGVQAEDAIGLFDEVARTMRRRDLTVWLERWGDLVTTAQRRARRVSGAHPAIGEHLGELLEAVADQFTITDWRAAAGRQADDSLRDLLDACVVDPVPGSRGLRFVRAAG